MNFPITTTSAILVLLILALTTTAASSSFEPNTDVAAATLFAFMMGVALLGSVSAGQPRGL